MHLTYWKTKKVIENYIGFICVYAKHQLAFSLLFDSGMQNIEQPFAHPGNSLYMERLWYHMCSCQPTVGLTILSL